MKDIINSAELVIPDGIGVQIGLKILGYKVKRIPGIVFARKILENSVSNNLRVALIGSKPEIIEKTVEKLKVEIPGINIVFSHDGYFKDDEKLFNDVINSSPDIVFFALGAPRQEECIYSIKKSLPKAIMIGVGGSFDVWSGNVQRAPEIYQNLGLEWLYRTVKEPKRLKRIFPTLPKFIFSVIKESWGKTC
ncbi:WecB/TagA/CpsF family glycosyltransferase [bacterium]|nr:WecB/TagA/CpsF family glycosyltransferase [bacterium]